MTFYTTHATNYTKYIQLSTTKHTNILHAIQYKYLLAQTIMSIK